MATPHTATFHSLARSLRRSERNAQLKAALRAPVQALRDLWWERKTFDVGANTVPGRSNASMLLHYYKLVAQHGYSLEEYFRYRLYQHPAEIATAFIPLRSNIAARTHLYESLNIDPTPLSDKRLLYRRCEEVGLPVPPTIADVHGEALHWWSAPELPACDLFSKEAASLGGAGAALWRYEGPSTWRNGQETFGADQLVDRLQKLSKQAPLIVQRKVGNHNEVADLSLGGLCTTRVVTLADPSGDNFSILTAVFRMPADESIVDNFQLGGLACPINEASGEMGYAVRKWTSVAHTDLDRHPVTGAAIQGRFLPRWKEIATLALDAHRAFPQYPSVGWDIANTTDGLMLLEGNYNWGIVLPQQAGLRPLGATEFPEHYLGWLQRAQPRSARE
mgnify:CR=1 FL=1